MDMTQISTDTAGFVQSAPRVGRHSNVSHISQMRGESLLEQTAPPLVSRPALCAERAALRLSSIVLVRSIPTAIPPGPTPLAASRVTSPFPHAGSSTALPSGDGIQLMRAGARSVC